LVQLEDGYLKIATELAEQFCKYRLSGEEWQVLWVIIRQTYGWNKKSDKISYSKIAVMSCMQRRSVIRAVNKLVAKGVVKKDTTRPITLSIQKAYHKWRVVSKLTPSVQIDTKVVSKLRTKVVSKLTPTKDNINTNKDRTGFSNIKKNSICDDLLEGYRQEMNDKGGRFDPTKKSLAEGLADMLKNKVDTDRKPSEALNTACSDEIMGKE